MQHGRTCRHGCQSRPGHQHAAFRRDICRLFNTPELRIEVDEAEKFDLVPRVLESLKAQANDNTSLDDIDGVRVSTSDGWGLLRPSNTQDVLVARVEASSKEGLQRLKNMAGEEVRKIGYSLQF